MKINSKIKKYLNLFENLSIQNLNNFDELIDDKIIFVDPFNKIKGKDNFKKLFKRTLTLLSNPKFKIIAVSCIKNIYFIKWKMEFNAFKKKQIITGLSEIKTNKHGLILEHIDYWDSFNQFYLKLPIFGKILKIFSNVVKKKI